MEKLVQESSLDFTFQNEWGINTATIHYPIKEEIKPHPIVIFIHGFAAWKELYTWIANSLVSNGFGALFLTVPNRYGIDPIQWSDCIKGAINYLGNDSKTVEKVDNRKIGVMGHSMGGLGALLAASQDTRIKCIVGLAPAILPRYLPIPKEVFTLLIPIQIQIGDKDRIIPLNNVRKFYSTLYSMKKDLVEISGGNHIQFIDKKIRIMGEKTIKSEVFKRFLRGGTAEISFEEQHAISERNYLRWLKTWITTLC